MVIKKVQLLFVATLTAFVTASCGVVNPSVNKSQLATPSGDCRRITHQMGKTEICGKPQRVVALGPDMLELLLALDVQPVGFADYVRFHQGNYDNPQQQIPYLGNQIASPLANVGWSTNPSLEAIVKVKPDLIISRELSADLYVTLSKIAPTLFLEQYDTEANLRAIATAVDQPPTKALAEIQQTVSKARQEFAPTVAAHPKVLMLIAAGTGEMRLVSSRDNPCSALVQDLGFQLVYPPNLDRSQQNSLPLSVEILPSLNQADSVIILGFDFGDNEQLQTVSEFANQQVKQAKQLWQKNAIAQSIRASKAGRIYFIPAYTCLGLPGPIGTELYLNELQQMR